MMTAVAGLCAALVAVLGLVTWFLKRKDDATPEQKLSDRQSEIDAIQREITTARYAGDDARADALLRRLRTILAGVETISPPGTAGQRRDGDAADRDGAQTLL
ncbi:MAG TPA: hypothetical protein VNT99_20320 [Methylomirabilota bacterium]|nr:hypothetical protein [Methylomirabilota bacterium]